MARGLPQLCGDWQQGARKMADLAGLEVRQSQFGGGGK